jgi:hypothetical protein
MSDSAPPALPFLSATVDENGISAPSYAEILQSLQESYRTIFGADVYLEADSQDGQLLAIFAKALSDTNDAAIACYNAYSPSTAVGAGLSSVVKINGIQRKLPSQSSAIVRVVGIAGTRIVNGEAKDSVNNFLWSLPPEVVVPSTGEIQVTAVCQTPGAIRADIGTINTINNPQLGWQIVNNNLNDAVPGLPVEDDAQLRRRQQVSVSIPSLSVLDGIVGGVWSVVDVTRVKGYENPEDIPMPVDLVGTLLPSHSIAIVVQGGQVDDICQMIALKKTPGSETTGDITEMVLDQYGIPNTIWYWQLINVMLTVQVTIKPLTAFTSTTNDYIRQAVVQFVNSFDVGEPSYHNRLFAPANLSGDAATDGTGQTQTHLDALRNTYNVIDIQQGIAQPWMGFDAESAKVDGFEIGSWQPQVIMVEEDIFIRFREAFVTDMDHVSVVIQP